MVTTSDTLSQRLQAASLVALCSVEIELRLLVHRLMASAAQVQPQGGTLADQYREAWGIVEALADGLGEARVEAARFVAPDDHGHCPACGRQRALSGRSVTALWAAETELRLAVARMGERLAHGEEAGTEGQREEYATMHEAREIVEALADGVVDARAESGVLGR